MKAIPQPAPAPKRDRRKRPTRQHPALSPVLLGDYNFWRSQCQWIINRRSVHRVADFVPTDERLELLTTMAAWCGARELDPRLWLFILFRAGRWFKPPPLDERGLMNERFVGAYQDATCLDAYRRHVVPQSVASAFDAMIDLAPANEFRKERLVQLGMQQRCLDQISSTLGYHPNSAACRRCPLNRECVVQTQAAFGEDILQRRYYGARQ